MLTVLLQSMYQSFSISVTGIWEGVTYPCLCHCHSILLHPSYYSYITKCMLLEFVPIVPAFCSLLLPSYYSKKLSWQNLCIPIMELVKVTQYIQIAQLHMQKLAHYDHSYSNKAVTLKQLFIAGKCSTCNFKLFATHDDDHDICQSLKLTVTSLRITLTYHRYQSKFLWHELKTMFIWYFCWFLA